jgi:hypothetical protein
VKLVRASDQTDVPGGGVAIAMSGGTAGQFRYGRLSNPVTLAAGTAYWVLSQEVAGGDAWYDWNTTVTTTSVAVDNAVAWGTGPGAWNTYTVPNRSFVPVNFSYTVSAGAAASHFAHSVSPQAEAQPGTSQPGSAKMTVFLGADLLSSKQITLRLVGQSGGRYIVEYSSDLIKWLPLGSTIIKGQVVESQDTNVPGLNQRFYRLAPAPDTAK